MVKVSLELVIKDEYAQILRKAKVTLSKSYS